MKKVDVKKTILPNGLVLINARRESDIFSIGAGIRAGSLYEDKLSNGMSHMVEHMLFKGTKKRDRKKLNDDIESLAGEFDIYTTYHETILNASTMKDRAEKCIEIISDLLINSSLPVNEFRMERKVIIEEIKMERDDPEDNAYLGLYKMVFPEDWHKFHITGSIKSVKSMDADAAKQFYREFYTPANTALCIVSPYSHEEINDMVNRYFGIWQGTGRQGFTVRPRGTFGNRVEGHKKGLGQAQVLYGFDMQGLSRREEIALALLNKKIGSGANSVLFRELRDNRGYAYNVYSDTDYIDGIKMFYIYAAVSKENTKNTVSIIDDTVERFASGSLIPDSRGISLIKDIFITDTAIAMESHGHMVDYLLDGEMGYNNPLEYENILSVMKDIGEEDLKNVAAKILKNPAVYILSPR